MRSYSGITSLIIYDQLEGLTGFAKLIIVEAITEKYVGIPSFIYLIHSVGRGFSDCIQTSAGFVSAAVSDTRLIVLVFLT